MCNRRRLARGWIQLDWDMAWPLTPQKYCRSCVRLKTKKMLKWSVQENVKQFKILFWFFDGLLMANGIKYSLRRSENHSLKFCFILLRTSSDHVVRNKKKSWWDLFATVIPLKSNLFISYQQSPHPLRNFKLFHTLKNTPLHTLHLSGIYLCLYDVSKWDRQGLKDGLGLAKDVWG